MELFGWLILGLIRLVLFLAFRSARQLALAKRKRPYGDRLAPAGVRSLHYPGLSGGIKVYNNDVFFRV